MNPKDKAERKKNGFFQIFNIVFQREWNFLFNVRRKFLIFCILFPLATIILLTGIFTTPVLRDLPIVVVDNDRSDVSRKLIEKVNAAPEVEVAYRAADPEEAKKLIAQTKAYGVLIIPEEFSRNVLGFKGAKVYLLYNNHLFLMGAIVKKGVVAAVQDFSNKYNVKYEERSGVPFYAADVKANPLVFNDKVLFNPYINYRYFFLLGLFPAFLQLFIIGSLVYAFYFDFKKNLFGELAPYVKKAPVTVYFAKTLPYILIFSFITLLMLFTLFYYIGAPFRAGFWIVMVSTFLFLATAIATGTMFALILRHISFSATAIYAAPAFAYAGITFPSLAMPAVAAAWSDFMPLSHYHKILINETMRGADIGISSTPHDALYLLIFASVCIIVSLFAMSFAASRQLLRGGK